MAMRPDSRLRARLIVFVILLVTALDLHMIQPYGCLTSAYGAAADQLQAVQPERQLPALPNGCEVTSLAMALQAASYPIDKETLYEAYLPKQSLVDVDGDRQSGSPEVAYIGDATDAEGGWYCFEQPVIAAGDAWLEDNGSARRMQQLSGMDQITLDAYAKNAQPLIVWVTLDYQPSQRDDAYAWTLPDGSEYVPYMNLHCVVLTGEEKGFYRIADPLAGWRFVKKDVFWQSFDAMGRRAVAVAEV